MSQKTLMMTLVLAALVATTAFAGGDHPCDKSAQECLNATAAKYAQHGWLGIETEKEEGRYRINAVNAGSPAEKAGFRAGDTLVALEGIALTDENKAQLKQVKKSLAVGSTVTYTVVRDGSKQKLTATLGKVPTEVLARWVGQHMLEYHVQDVVAQAN